MINKKKITPKVWFDYELWDVVKIISPNKFDDFLLLSRKITTRIHEDDKTTPIDMVLLHCGNDEFYPNTKEVKSIMKESKDKNERERINNETLSNCWLEIVSKWGNANP